MRGLTLAERAALLDALTPADPEGDVAEPDKAVVFERLVEQDRACEIAARNERWEWHEWRATDLGHLALRVCPVEDT